MRDAQHQHLHGLVSDAVDDPIITYPDSPSQGNAPKLLGTGGPGIARECIDAPRDAPLELGGELAELPPRRRREANLVGQPRRDLQTAIALDVPPGDRRRALLQFP